MSALPTELYENLLNNLHEGLYIVDREMKITYWNDAAEQITGFSKEQVEQHRCSDNILRHVDADGINLCENGCPLHATIFDRKKREASLFLHHKEGYRVPVSVRTSYITDDRGNVTHGIELFTDLSGKEQTELRIRELERLALLDTLTQLANREFLMKEFSARFSEKRKYLIPFGVMFIDIDHFKVFNDKYGHNTGDQILKMVSDTLSANTRPFDIFGRWGGEEFIGIIKNTDIEYLRQLSRQVRILIEQAFILKDETQLHCTVSVGATLALPDDTAESLINRADTLMYESKKNGRNMVTVG
ncbi:MAG: sensor domain-containing diguanylate cyclase [Sphaerochaetaceae bacterium]|nr:sensor domain-containing diguanylate cyclase [Sphaerochaetaceae bacterium]